MIIADFGTAVRHFWGLLTHLTCICQSALRKNCLSGVAENSEAGTLAPAPTIFISNRISKSWPSSWPRKRSLPRQCGSGS